MKAVVLEVRGREAALLMEDGTVRKVRGKYEVGQQLVFYDLVRPGVRQWVAAVVVAAILLTGSVGMWFNNNYVSYAEVSLDAEASIVYSLNRRNRVLSVRAANAEAEPVVQTLDEAGIRFTALPEALDMTMDRLNEAGYLKGGVLASVASDSETQRETLAEQVEAAMDRRTGSAPGLEYRVDRTDRATAREAEENGMSPGRYGAWQQSGGEKSAEEFARMPVEEIMGHSGKEAAPEAVEQTQPKPEEVETRQEERPEVEAQPKEEPQPDAEPVKEEPNAEGEPSKEEPKAEAVRQEPEAEPPKEESRTENREPSRSEGGGERQERSESRSERHEGGHDGSPGGGPGGGPGR